MILRYNRLQITDHLTSAVGRAQQRSCRRLDRAQVCDDIAVFFEERQHADRLARLEPEDDVSLTRADHRGVHLILIADPNVTEDVSAALRHTDGFGAHDFHPFFHGGGRDELGGEDSTLTAYAAEYDVLIHSIHLQSHPSGISASTAYSLCRENHLSEHFRP